MVDKSEKFSTLVRVGYFSRDDESTAQSPVFNRTVSLRDTWSKLASGQR